MKHYKLTAIFAILLITFIGVSLSHAANYEEALSYWEFDDSAVDGNGSNNAVLSGAGSELMTRPTCDSEDSAYFFGSMGATITTSDGRINVTETTGNVAGVYHNALYPEGTNAFTVGKTIELKVNVDLGDSGVDAISTYFAQYYNSAWSNLTNGQALYAGDNTLYFDVTANAATTVRGRIVSGYDMASGGTYSLDNWQVRDAPAHYVDGNIGSAVSFDGNDDYVQLADAPELNFERTDAFTIGGWIKSGAVEVSEIYCRMLTDSTFRGIQLFTSSNYGGTLGFGLYSDVGSGNYMQGYSTANILDDEWHHVLIAYDGSSSFDGVTMYIDGVENAKQGVSDNLSGVIQINQTPYIGRRADGYNFDGSIDDLGIWGRALDAYEIAAIYDMGIEKFEALSIGVNNVWGLDLTTEEISQLAQLYADGKDGLDTEAVVAGDNSWTYLSGDLPGDFGGTTYDIGDSWVYGGKYYIKLGSGLEGGAVPELPPMAGQTLLFGFGMIGVLVTRLKNHRAKGEGQMAVVKEKVAMG